MRARACVRAQQLTIEEVVTIKLYWYEIIHQCTLQWAFYLHILFSPADTVHSGASPGSAWQCRECTNNIRVYLYQRSSIYDLCLYKVLCIVILMAACCMEMISESSYIFNSCYSK